MLGDANWSQPLRWNAAAAAADRRDQVFCASMADVFEDRRDLDDHRARLWALIADTPNLNWQLLTKRPQLIAAMVPWGNSWPDNVWIGTTVENQQYADERLPHLTALPAAVRFISAEPLLGPLDISAWAASLDWVITGGESGHGSRPTSPSWFRSLRDQCIDAEIAFLFKQWGDWAPHRQPVDGRATSITANGKSMVRLGKKSAGRRLGGRTWDEMPR